jgi:hypothetical protein
MFVYDAPDHKEHVALILGALDGGGPVLVRAHSECLTGDVFGSSRCDCGEQLDESLRFLQEQGRGVLQGRPQSERAQQLRQASLQQLVIGGLGEYFDPFTGKLLAESSRLYSDHPHGLRRQSASGVNRTTSRTRASVAAPAPPPNARPAGAVPQVLAEVGLAPPEGQ